MLLLPYCLIVALLISIFSGGAWADVSPNSYNRSASLDSSPCLISNAADFVCYNTTSIEFSTSLAARRRLAAYSTPSVEIGSHTRIQVTIAVITMNRIDSLKRLIDSLLRIENSNNRQINIIFNLEASSPQTLLDYVFTIDWPFGWKVIKKRLLQGGLITAITESWFPSSDLEFGMLLEDDIEVSPLVMVWVEKVIASPIMQDPHLLGISLYTPRVTETTKYRGEHGEEWIQGVSRPLFKSSELTASLVGDPNAAFLMQTPCSWGAVFFPKHWREFLEYMKSRLHSINKQPHVSIPQSLTNGWKGSWKRFMFELMWTQDYFMLYPNFKDQASLSTNHLEAGVHIKKKQLSKNRNLMRWQYTVPLLFDEAVLNALTIPDRIAEIPALNLFGQPYNTRKSLEVALNHLSCVLDVNCTAVELPNSQRYFKDKTPSVTERNLCKQFANITSEYLSHNNGFTIYISTMNRLDMLLQQIDYYSLSPVVSKIMVTWHNKRLATPRPLVVNNITVHFISHDGDSLNNRFVPLLQITSSAVLIIDDDMKVSLADLALLFEVWKKYPNNIVGFSSRVFGDAKLAEGEEPSVPPQMVYVQNSEDPPFKAKEGTPPKKGYGLMLTKAMMLHKRYLHDYSCDSNVLASGFRKYIDAHMNCEDIYMNGVVAYMRNGYHNAPPLYVTPLNPIGDFGKIGSNNLHKRGNHGNVRSTCLNLVNYFHYEHTGNSLPLQTDIIQTRLEALREEQLEAPVGGPPPKVVSYRVDIRKQPYKGISKLVVLDCFGLETDPEEACDFNTTASDFLPMRYKWN